MKGLKIVSDLGTGVSGMIQLTSNKKLGSNENPSHDVHFAVLSLRVDSVVDTESVVGEVSANSSDSKQRSHIVKLSLPRRQ